MAPKVIKSNKDKKPRGVKGGGTKPASMQRRGAKGTSRGVRGGKKK